MSLAGEPQFGTATSGVDYVDRPGVYALAIHDGRLLVLETAAGYFLPGGGTDDGETAEDALRRELLEEAGLDVDGLIEIGRARQYVVDSATGIGYNKIETFYRVMTVDEGTQPVELDHAARWVSVSEALDRLREPAQAWAVRRLPPSSSHR